jgi:hypothetical protein
MQPRLNPHVVDHYPDNVESNVSLNSSIKVKFSKNLNSESVNDNTFMVIEQGVGSIEGDLKYERSTKTIIFKPKNLFPDKKYQVVISGNLNSNDPQHSILDALDNPLETNYAFSFTTTKNPQLKSPEIINPGHQTIIHDLNFEWSKVNGAEKYRVLISKDKLFDKNDYENEVFENKINVSDLDLNNEYFMKIKSISSENESDWSDYISFYYEKEFTSKNESTSSNVIGNLFEVKNIENEKLNIDPSLSEIIIEVNEMVELSDIDISLIGKSINNIPYIESHGEINGSIEIIEQKEGYTKIRYVI